MIFLENYKKNFQNLRFDYKIIKKIKVIKHHIMRQIMNQNDLKLEELRLIFERENTRKQNLENKASYFLVVISITMTIICTYFGQPTLFPKFDILKGITFIISMIAFLVSIGLCILIFLPRDYYHPFDLETFEDFEKSFKISDNEFEENLYDQYLTSIHANHEKNNDIAKQLKYSVYSFICFTVLLILSVVIL